MTTINLQQSFTARLEGQSSNQRVPVLLIDRQLIEVDSSGWLCLPSKYSDALVLLRATLRFDFLGQYGDSCHYRVSCATRGSYYFERQLGRSRNGYLGFYGSVSSDVFWKIDVINGSANGESPVFTLSDHQGRAVGSLTENSLAHGQITYLVTSDFKPNVQQFTLADYQPI
ncbi:hypothetical protein [Pseudomonas sp. CC120222-01a]|uniref:hypothetical protein n=1 Tax=Pseudomonas sp. CC120222-01a TaxID=1378075 RepID=UPI000D9ADE86|nr:hypothetical protein [Pseudomonas sp. CC120222-01a]PVZ40810.1 hypothetical protein N430_02761 [Pseudomonas sp. CC120222-01a]